MFALAQWLKTTPLPELALWIAKTPLSALVDANYWIAATLQTIHILSVAGVFVAVLMTNLRIFQLAGRSQTMAQTVARYAPWVWWGLLILFLTGFLLIMGEPARELLNPCFWTKMVLVVVAAAIALWFQDSVRRHAERWTLAPHGAVVIRVGAGAVIALWIVIMLLGRWIAYAPI